MIEVSKTMKQLPGRPSSIGRNRLDYTLVEPILHEDSEYGGRLTRRGTFSCRTERFSFKIVFRPGKCSKLIP